MANININNLSELYLNGNDLFADSEGFMTELSQEEEQVVLGGQLFCRIWTCQVSNFVINKDGDIIIYSHQEE